MLEFLALSLQNILDMFVAEPTTAIWLLAFIVVWLLAFRVVQSLKGQKLSSFNLKVFELFELGLKFENSDSKSSTKSDENSKDK